MEDTFPWKARRSGGARRRARPEAGPPGPEPEFPGCTPRRISRGEIEGYEGRLEFWDGDRGIAWVAEPTSPYHEQPVATLSALADRISAVRGSPIKCYGSMDLRLRDEDSRPRRILQADQSVYLHPTRAVLPGLSAMVLGDHDFPDVVLEVDHSTDVRRGKLGLYEEWGFPEVWVEVPDTRAPSRPRGRLPGLTIHLLSDDGTYRIAPESRAFPGWEAEEIHAALNEKTASPRTYAILERIGMALGAREGTGPDDDPLLRSQRVRSYERGHAHGRAHSRADMVRRILLSRGIEIADDFPANVPAFADATDDAVVSAALACRSENDFRVRLLPGRT